MNAREFIHTFNNIVGQNILFEHNVGGCIFPGEMAYTNLMSTLVDIDVSNKDHFYTYFDLLITLQRFYEYNGNR